MCTDVLRSECDYTYWLLLYIEGIEQVGSVRHVEMLFRTNLIAIVGGGSHPKYADNTGMYLLTDSCSNICFVMIIFTDCLRLIFMFWCCLVQNFRFPPSPASVALEHFCC